MSIMHMDSGFRAHELAQGGPGFGAIGARPTLSHAAANAARGFAPRAISAAALGGLGRLADFALLALTGLIILRLYVVPIDGFGLRYVIAAALLPIATIVLIGA